MSGTLGFNYKLSSNKNTNATIASLQNVIKNIQAIGCETIIPKIIYELNNMPYIPNFETNPQKFIEQSTATIVDNIKIDSPALVNELKNSIRNTYGLLVNNSTTKKGKVDVIDQSLIKKNMVDFFSSICQGKIKPYVPPPLPANNMVKYYIKKMQQDGSSTQTLQSVLDGGSISIGGYLYTSDYLKKLGQFFENGIPIITIDIRGNASPYPEGPVPSYAPTYGQISSGDSSGSSRYSSSGPGPVGFTSYFGNNNTTGGNHFMLWFIIIAVVIVLILAFFIYKGGKAKGGSTVAQKIAEFGRHIKSISKL